VVSKLAEDPVVADQEHSPCLSIRRSGAARC
jgi:hypothetical protein